MKRSKWTLLTAGVALTWIGTVSAPALAQTIDVVRAAQAAQVDKIQVDKIAQSNPPAAPRGTQSPMVKPPDAASGVNGQNGADSAPSATNPDNMPIKRPDKPTNDKMSRQPPASGANAK
ncbi:hypothetical protein SAMN05443245_1633 [Paraburkholderia fungorum]|uniref:Uncharacterized protein n=1 Tax=Paraburkholderia fungorum TaxID=134537 RepID=A0A1H1BF10_9BURK|nr:hypothetical protein [Paraburkholderia fungorum]SDQ50538.1 hypothetical protein SAMN05443245_1633 [Paraburkholderia fungorum]